MTQATRMRTPKATDFEVNEPSGRNVEALPVSRSWKEKFRLIQRAGGTKLPELRTLSAVERFKISFNILAFLIGPLYYLIKGMWKKAFSLSGVCLVAIVVIGVAFELMSQSRLGNALGYGAAAVFAVRANIDYYKKVVLGENGWW